MKSFLSKIGEAKFKIKIEYSKEEFKDSFWKTTLFLGKNLEIEGFRKGKAPLEILERKIGREKILRETAIKLINKGYQKVISEKNLEIIGEPLVRILKLSLGDCFVFELEVWAILPPHLPDYRQIAKKIKRKKIEVKKEEVEKTLKWLQSSRVKFVPKKGKAERGDFVEIEYKSEVFKKGKTYEDKFILGKGKLISNLENEILGMKEGEEKKVRITFPKDYKEKELAGKETEIILKLKKVFYLSFPEIDDQFARELGNFKDLASLKESIKEGIKKEKEIEEKKRILEELLDKISAKTEIELPEILIEKEKERQIENFKKNISTSLKISFEEYLKKIKKEEKEIEEYFLKLSKEFIKRSLILREIAKKENIKVFEQEINERINQYLKKFKSPKEAEKEVDLEKLRLYTEEEIRNEKVLNFLESLVPSLA